MSSRLAPLTDAEARDCELIFRLTQGHLGFVPNSMRTMAREPAILSSFTLLVGNVLGQPSDAKTPWWLGIGLIIKNIVWSIRNVRSKHRLPLALKNMVAHVCSNAAGCRYCQAHTIGEARDQGVPLEKLRALCDFETSDLFNKAELAALRFAYAAGSFPNAVDETHFAELREHYNENQIVELGATVALFGFLNRWNDTFATTLESNSRTFAESELGPSGWTVGKHTNSMENHAMSESARETESAENPTAAALCNAKCVPCEGGVAALERADAEKFLAATPQWKLATGGNLISRKIKRDHFMQVIQLVNEIAALAEREQHHPDLHVTGYRHLQIDLTTHAIGGLSENDFIVAAKIDRLVDGAAS